MPALILDFGMNDQGGHHVGVAKSFIRDLDGPKSDITLLTNKTVRLAALSGVRVLPVFSATGYEFFDIKAGQLRAEAVRQVADKLVFDLLHLEPLLQDADRIHVLNANALILRVIADWLVARARPLTAQLEIHVMFNLGVTLRKYGPTWCAVQLSPFWKETALRAHATIGHHCAAVTYIAASRQRHHEMRYLFGISAPIWANPGIAKDQPEWRRSLRAPYVCFGLGDAKLGKGVALLPDLIEGCLARHDDLCLALQIQGDTETHADIYHRLRDLAATHARFCFCEEHLPNADYADLLEGAALLVLPYQKEQYFARASSVLEEAIQGNVPCVVPEYTELWDVLRKSKVAGFAFQHNTTESILEAVDTGIRSVIAPAPPLV